MSLVYTPMWAENMTAGRGWIALALVVFATWRPARLLLGAYLFGGITILQLYVQATRLRDSLAVPLHAALSRHHRGAGPDLARPARGSASTPRPASAGRSTPPADAASHLAGRLLDCHKSRFEFQTGRLAMQDEEPSTKLLGATRRRTAALGRFGAGPRRRALQGRLHLCRPGRRFRLEPSARPRAQGGRRRRSATR